MSGATGQAVLLRGLFQNPVLRNSAALIALRASNLAARLTLLFFVARQVAPAEFGMVALAFSLVEVAKVLSDFGLDTLAIREYSAQRDRTVNARFAASLAASRLVLGVVVYGALAAYLLITQRGHAAFGLVLGLTTFTGLLTNFSLAFFQARLRVAEVLPRVVLTNLVLTVVVVWALPQIPSLGAKAACFLAVELAIGLVLALAISREALLGPRLFALGEVAPLLKRSLPIAFTAIVIMLYSRLDVLVLSSRLGHAAVGYYGIAFRFTEPFQLAAAALGSSVFSHFSLLFHRPAGQSLRAPALRYLGATLAYGLAAAGALWLLAPPLVTYGLPAYTAAIPIVQILTGALVLRAMNATLTGILQGAGDFRWLAGFAVWNLVLTYGLLVAMVPRFGAAGAAWAMLIGEAGNALLQLGLVLRRCSVTTEAR